MALSATFVANFSNLYKELDKAEVRFKDVAFNAEKVQKSVQTIGERFSGAKVIEDAAKMAAAIESIGGAAILTEKEARRVNAALSEALEKAAKTGAPVTDQMKKLAAETAGAANQGGIYEKVIGSIGTAAKTAAASFAALFAFQQIVATAKAIVDFGGEMTDLASKTGLSTTALQQFKYAGGQVGVELSSITGGVNMLQKRLAGDDKSAVKALEGFGLSVGEFKALKPEDQFKTIAEKVGSIEDPMLRTKAATDLFGKSGAELLPALTKEFGELTDRANSLGIVMDEQTVAAMDTLGDTVSDLGSVAFAALGKIIAPLVPLLSGLAQVALVVANAFGDVLGKTIDVVGGALKWLANRVLDVQIAMAEGIKTATSYVPGLNKLTGVSDAYGTVADKLRQMQAALNTETAKAEPQTRAVAAATEVATKATDGHAKAVASLVKELSGAGAIEQVKTLEAAFKALTPEQRANQRIVDDVLGRYVKLREVAGDQAAPALETLFRNTGTLKARTVDLTAAMVGLKPAIESTIDSYAELEPLAAKNLQIFSALPKAVTSSLAPVTTLGSTIKGSLAASFTELPNTILGALKGGGSVMESAGSLFGSGIGSSLVKNFGGNITKLLGPTIGTALNSVIPGLGALMGPLLGAVSGKLAGMFGGVSEEVKKVRGEIATFEETLRKNLTTTQAAEAAGRNWAATTIAVRDAYTATGRSAAEAEAVVRQLWDDKNPAAARAAIEQINAVMAEAKKAAEALQKGFGDAFGEALAAGVTLPESMQGTIQSLIDMGKITGDNVGLFAQLTGNNQSQFKAMEDAAKKYGVELSALGPAFAQNRMNEQATSIIDAFTTMTKGGADLGGVIGGMSDEINQFVAESMKAGTKVPENMRPVLEAMLEQGKLTDANGKKLDDLSGINFGPPVESAFDKIIGKLQELIDKLTGGAGFDKATQAASDFGRKATEAINSVPSEVRVRFRGEGDDLNDDGDPGFAGGTISRGAWFRNFGTGTATTLHGTEAVVRQDQAGAFAEAMGGGSATVDELRALRADMMALPQHLARAVRDAILVAT